MLDVTITEDSDRVTTTGAWTHYPCAAGDYELSPEDTSVRFYQGNDGSRLPTTGGRFIARDASKVVHVSDHDAGFWYYLPAGGKLNISRVKVVVPELADDPTL